MFWSSDFWAGALTGLLAAIAVSESTELRSKAVEALLVEGGLGVAILAVVLGALAILVSFLGEEYLVVLERTPGGAAGAFLPYKIVAVVAGFSTLACFISAFTWSLCPGWLQAAGLGLATFASVWALVGTVQLVFITADHGMDRFDLMREMRQAAVRIRQRKDSA